MDKAASRIRLLLCTPEVVLLVSKEALIALKNDD